MPPGVTTAEITGQTTSGMFFREFQVQVFNRDDSYYTPAQINANSRQTLVEAYDKKHGIDTSNGAVAPPPVIPKAAQQRAASMAIDDLYAIRSRAREGAQVKVNPSASVDSLGTAQAASVTRRLPVVVSIPTKHGK